MLDELMEDVAELWKGLFWTVGQVIAWPFRKLFGKKKPQGGC